MARPEGQAAELDRLWRAVKRDLLASVEVSVGLRDDPNDRRWKRLLKNWSALCALNIDIAASLYHGLEQVSMMLARAGDPNGPSAHRLRQMDEVLGLVEIGRAANPTAEVETVGELLALGEDAIARDIDADLDDER